MLKQTMFCRETTMTDTEHETEHDTKALLAKAIAALPETVSLIFIDRDEEFTDKQCAAIVGGQKDEVWEDMDFSEGEDHSIDMYLDDALPDEEEREALKESDEFDEFRQECYERDESTAYKDLLRNTGRKLVRFYIRTPGGNRIAMEPDSWRWDNKRIEREAKRLAKVTKLDFASNRENLRELVTEASYGGVLCIIAYVEMQDVDKWVEHCLYGDERGRVKLTFTNPNLLMHDAYNGSGHCVEVAGDITIDFGRGALDTTHGVMALDAKNAGTGYSWDDTSVAYRPAYKCDPAVTLYQAAKGQRRDRPAPEAWPGNG
jgi:hypothetical protein